MTNIKMCRYESHPAGKSLLERNEELAARNRAVAEQCQQKLEVRSSFFLLNTRVFFNTE